MPVDFSTMNPLFSWILRSPFHWLVSPGVTLITVTGRRTGRRYTIPVGYQRDGDTVVILVSEASKKQWWRNYVEPGPAELLLKGMPVRGSAQVMPPESPEFREWAERTFRRLPFLGRQFSVAYNRRAGLTDAQVAHLGREAAIVKITLEREEPNS